MNIQENEKLLFDLSEFFKLFGDSTRIKILYALLDKEMNVTELSAYLKMTQPAISQQLRILKTSDLLGFRKEGKSTYYFPLDDHIKSILNLGMEHITEEE